MPGFNRRYRPVEMFGQPVISIAGLLLTVIALPFLIMVQNALMTLIGVSCVITGVFTMIFGYVSRSHGHFMFSYLSSWDDERCAATGAETAPKDEATSDENPSS